MDKNHPVTSSDKRAFLLNQGLSIYEGIPRTIRRFAQLVKDKIRSFRSRPHRGRPRAAIRY